MRVDEPSPTLGEAARLEIARRLDLAIAAIDIVGRTAYAAADAEQIEKSLLLSKAPFWSGLIGLLAAVAGAWLWSGAYVLAAICFANYVQHGIDVERAKRELRSARRRLDEARTLWVMARPFGVDLEPIIAMGRSEVGIDHDSDEYQAWWKALGRGIVKRVVSAQRGYGRSS